MTNTKHLIALLPLITASLLIVGCKNMGSHKGESTATAILAPTDGNDVHGKVRFVPVGKGVRVVAQITGLSPGKHGFHIHEFGDCSAADASSAGGHFNPAGAPHGSPEDRRHHVGDLGNIVADDSGTARVDKVYDHLKLSGTQSIIGRSVIVHSGADDLESQPSGDAGQRVACGVIVMR